MFIIKEIIKVILILPQVKTLTDAIRKYNPVSLSQSEEVLVSPYFEEDGFVLHNDDCTKVMAGLPENSIDMIFADPPYFLSNNGMTCKSGKMVSVNKGEWDSSNGFHEDVKFHDTWIKATRRILKPEGTIWISGTYHSIYKCGYLLQEKGFEILNDIAWLKPNASPNLSRCYFTASHETLIWAKKDKGAKHYFNYELMKNNEFPNDKLKISGKQMRSGWSIPPPRKSEKLFGSHPTQKPISLLNRIVAASTKAGDVILDPFCGSGTTGIAVKLAGKRTFIGIDTEVEYLQVAKSRYEHNEIKV